MTIPLFCLPFATSAALPIYASWSAGIAPARVLPIDFPGHGARMSEPLAEAWDPLVDDVHRAVTSAAPAGPVALFGYSLGALVAYEVTRRLEREMRDVVRLFVAACASPDRAYEEPFDDSRDGIVALLRELGGTPEEVLRDAGILDIFVPIARADFRLAQSYTPVPSPILAPITGFFGVSDPRIPISKIDGWARATRGGFRAVRFLAGHLFHVSHANEITTTIAHALAK